MKKNNETILKVLNLKKSFSIRKGIFHKNYINAVNDVSFSLKEGEIIGIAGESGCGKTTLGKTIVRIYKPDAGTILYKNNDISNINENKMNQFRQKIQYIFQDPTSCLNPRHTVEEILSEPLISFSLGDKNKRSKIILDLIDKTKLSTKILNRYPNELSNGQRQRVSIARAIATKPSVIIADEPISALDVSIQSDILRILNFLKKEMNISIIFISHDLNVMEYFTDRIYIMYLGKIVEFGNNTDVFLNPQHPYTRALLSAVPRLFPKKNDEHIYLNEHIADYDNIPIGCPFNTRCFMPAKDCPEVVPELKEISPGHYVRCLLID